MAGPSPLQSPKESQHEATSSTEHSAKAVTEGHPICSVDGLQNSLQLLLQQFREEVEASFNKYEEQIERVSWQMSQGQCQITISAEHDSKLEPIAQHPLPHIHNPPSHRNHNSKQSLPRISQTDDHNEPCPPTIPPSMPPARLSLVDRQSSDTPVGGWLSSSSQGSAGLDRRRFSIERLKRLRQKDRQKDPEPENSRHLDGLVKALVSHKPKRRYVSTFGQYEFQARPLASEESWFRRCASSKAYRFLRAIAVLVDASLVVIELQRSSQLVADNRDATEVPYYYAWALSICCAFFWIDLFMALLLEFPRFDICVGRTGYRFLNVLATIQLTLALVGAYVAPGTRFTSQFRRAVGLFICLRIARPMVVLPELGGRKLHKTLGELHVMIRALTGTLRALLWCTLMCFIILLICSVFFAEAAAAHLVLAPAALPESSDSMLAQTWGTVSRSVFSLFTATFGGQDWATLYDALDPLAWTPKLFFCGFICFTYIALLNTVTAVFIKCAFMRLEQDREFVVQQELDDKRDYLKTVATIFRQLDPNDTGIVEFPQLAEHLQNPKISAYFTKLGVDTEEVEKLFLLMDEDGSGSVTQEEFMVGCLRLKGEAKSLDLELLHQDVKFMLGTMIDSHEQLQTVVANLDRIDRELKTRPTLPGMPSTLQSSSKVLLAQRKDQSDELKIGEPFAGTMPSCAAKVSSQF